MHPRSAKSLAAPAVMIVEAWLIAGIFFGWHHNLVMQTRAFAQPWHRTASTILMVVLWTFSAPLVFAFSDRLAVRRPVRARNLIVLTAAAVGFAALRAVVDHALLQLLIARTRMTPAASWDGIVLLFHSELLFTIVLIALANYLRIERETAAAGTREVRLQTMLAEARLHQLRVDLHPHFLFNTLNTIAAFTATDPAAAEEMVVKLRDLLRASVDSQNVREVPLETELQFIARYLDIQKLRFGARLVASIDVADPRLARACVPPLLLQPLVENSIVHGLGRRAGGGRVDVLVDAVDAWLRIRIVDDGPGADPDTIFARGSLGVPNAKARLEVLYGARHAFHYTRGDGQFVAEVRIPLRLDGAA